MSTLLRVNNFDSNNIKEIGRVAFDAAAGQKVIKFDSSQGLVQNDVCFVGRRGTEFSERLVVDTISGFDVTFTANLTMEHRRFQPLIALKGDQIKIYRAANVDGKAPSAASFAALAGMPIAIDPDQGYTDYEDPTGGSDYWYRYTYYNSFTTAETAIADSPATRGGGYGHYATVDGIRVEAGMTSNVNILDSLVDECRVSAEDEINTTLQGMYTLPFAEPIPPTITRITELLAAGNLLNKDYGPLNSSGTSKRGDAKIKEGRAALAALKSQDKTVLDESMVPLLLEDSSKLINSWPNNSTETTPEESAGSARKFRMEHKF